MPLSTLHGRPRTFVARFVRDVDGRVVGFEGELSSGWTDDDLAAVLAVKSDEQRRCGQCGHPREESHAVDNDGRYRAEPSQCHACAAAQRAVDGLDPEGRIGVSVRTWLT